MEAGKKRGVTEVKGGGRKQSCRQDYRTCLDVETGNQWERKCAGSRRCDKGRWNHWAGTII